VPVNGLKFAMAEANENAKEGVKAFGFHDSGQDCKNGIVAGAEVYACVKAVFSGDRMNPIICRVLRNGE